MDGKAKKLAFLLIFLIGLTLGTVFSLVITPLPTEYISLYQGAYANSRFRIDSLITHVLSPNKVIITIKLTNTNTAIHSANVTVYLYDSSGNELAHQTKNTGDVGGGNSVVLVFIFNNISVASYDHPFIEVYDTS